MFKIALLGQVNVGKSTLFNRLIEKQKAITYPTPGTTRDRNYGICRWRDKKFIIIDTGGIEKKTKDEIGKEVKKQIIKAIEETDLIFFILDINEEISNFEAEASRIIKKSKKTTILVLNKADSPKRKAWAEDKKWLKLGFSQPTPVSAANGIGIGDLLDRAMDLLAGQPDNRVRKSVDTQFEQNPIKVAIIGRPNVGKSTLLNALLGEERAVVSSLPHTTRGPQDTPVYYQNQILLLIDTAGIRKKAKIRPGIEKIGVQKSLKAIQKSDIVLMVLDLGQEISHQDKALINLAIKDNKGLILIINKSDLLPKQDLDGLIKSNLIKKWLPLAWWAPFIFISAKTGKNVKQIFDLIRQVEKNRNLQIGSRELNDFLKQIIKDKGFNPVVWEKTKMEQIKIKPPTFIIKIPQNIIRKKLTHQAQINIIEKQIRKKWGFQGTPITIKTLKH